MSYSRLLFYLCISFLIFWLLHLLSGILMPFAVGIVVAYFLNPSVRLLEKHGFNRTFATVFVSVLFFIIVMVGFLLLFPLAYREIMSFISDIPSYLERAQIFFAENFSFLYGFFLEKAETAALVDLWESHGTSVLKISFQFLQKIFVQGLSFANLLSLLLITPIVAFYLMRDWPLIIRRIDALLPLDYADDIRRVSFDINERIAGFIRGQFLVCILLGLFYGISLFLFGLNFGLLVGLLAGVISFIPYLGTIIGFSVSVGIAFFQYSSWLSIFIVAGIFIAGQILETGILSPRLLGSRVGLHPVWIIFGLLAGGYLFGITGMLLSIPVAASIGVLVRFFIERYMSSSFYDPSL